MSIAKRVFNTIPVLGNLTGIGGRQETRAARGEDIADGRLVEVTGTGSSQTVAHGLSVATGAIPVRWSALPTALSIVGPNVSLTLTLNATCTLWVF